MLFLVVLVKVVLWVWVSSIVGLLFGIVMGWWLLCGGVWGLLVWVCMVEFWFWCRVWLVWVGF